LSVGRTEQTRVFLLSSPCGSESETRSIVINCCRDPAAEAPSGTRSILPPRLGHWTLTSAANVAAGLYTPIGSWLEGRRPTTILRHCFVEPSRTAQSTRNSTAVAIPLPVTAGGQSGLLWLQYCITRGTVPNRKSENLAQSYILIFVEAILTSFYVVVLGDAESCCTAKLRSGCGLSRSSRLRVPHVS
jgi:hypothetical protein